MAASCWSTTVASRSRTTHRDDVCGLAIQRQIALLVLALTLTACSRTDPGISREKAEAVLKVYDYTEIALQAAPDGWSGTAIPASDGYWMSVMVDQNGMLRLQPCACGGKVLRLARDQGAHRPDDAPARE